MPDGIIRDPKMNPVESPTGIGVDPNGQEFIYQKEINENNFKRESRYFTQGTPVNILQEGANVFIELDYADEKTFRKEQPIIYRLNKEAKKLLRKITPPYREYDDGELDK